MKLSSCLLPGLALLLLTAQPGNATDMSGTNNRLEWQVVQDIQLPHSPVDVACSLDPRGQFLHLSDRDNNTLSTLAIDSIADIQTENAPTKGRVDAPVTIAVYSDFQ